jgi:hypothetical protein
MTDWRWASKGVGDSVAYFSSKMDMDYDGEGNPVILWENWNYSDIRLTRRQAGEWKSSLFQKTNISVLDFYQLALKVDKSGNIHALCPKKYTNFPDLAYLKMDTGGAISEPLAICEGCGTSGKWVSMTLDSTSERPVAAYYRHSGENLHVSHFGDDGWKSLHIEEGPDTALAQGFYNNIVRIPNSSKYYISYQDRVKGNIRLAKGDLTSPKWESEVVDTLTGFTIMSTRSTLAVDREGTPFVAYARAITDGNLTTHSSRLMLAVKRDGQWTHEVIDSSVTLVGEGAYIDISPSGLPAIAYLKKVNDKYRLMTAIASLEAPADTNGNSIPDYLEPPSSIRRSIGARKAGKSKPMRFDALGKSAPPGEPKCASPCKPEIRFRFSPE